MDNRFFSLIIVPDSGNEVRTGSFNYRYMVGIFSALIAMFFLCLFFIIGYHIKLSQEIDYKQAVKVHNVLLDNIANVNGSISDLSRSMTSIQNNDKAIRLIESMNVIDEDMYQAGIGGHVIADLSDFNPISSDLQVTLRDIVYETASLSSRINVQENSLGEIQGIVRKNREMIDNTPSIIPTHSYRVTSSYGYRTHPVSMVRHFHGAIDLGGHKGQDIFATADGVVILASYQGPLGNCVKIRHKYGYETLYGHLNKIYVKKGQKVSKRDVIGAMGRTGRVTGVHLHYAVILNTRAENPVKYFQ